MRSYSQLFACLHDEQAPIGDFGRGTHYSVFRTAEWFNVTRQPLTRAEMHDFAVVWDEDHDTRVIGVAEKLYIEGLFSPVQFIGERKGTLTVIVASRFRWWGTDSDWLQWKKLVKEVSRNVEGDSWNVEFGNFDKSFVGGVSHQTDTMGIISEAEERAITYLRNIDNLWNLGTWPFKDRVAGTSVFAPSMATIQPAGPMPPVNAAL